MRIAVTTDYHFVRGPDGVYTDSVYPYAWWAPLRAVFDEVVVLARVRDASMPRDARRVDGPGLAIAALPEFVGSSGLIGASPALISAVWTTARAADAFLLRAPGVVATVLREVLRITRRPYGIAVGGDPLESLVAGDRRMRALRRVGAAALREQVRGAAASRFVTTRHLQERYPPRAGTFTVGASDVQIPDALFDAEAPVIRDGPQLRISFVGMMERAYKGLDVLLEALALTRGGHTLAIVGDGALRASHEAQRDQLGLGERVRFLGTLAPGAAMFEFLRAHDLFVLPSRTEGMPRVLVEAMAVGLPALATPVGGVPELIEPSELIPIEDAAALARAIDQLAFDPVRRRRLAAANRERARGYRASVTDTKLAAFYAAIRDACLTG